MNSRERFKSVLRFGRPDRVPHIGAMGFWESTTVILPLFIEAGINVYVPLEIAAGMEPVLVRERFGTALVLMGGIDKRVLSTTKEAIKEEVMRKVPKMHETGGYIPGVDHNVPHDIPFENYCYFVELLRGLDPYR